jgi:predicted DNA-binding transcriptional regulator YafY
MAKPFQISPQELKNARLLLKNHTNEREYRCALIVIFLADNIYTAEQIADHFEIGVRTVFEDLVRIRSFSL